jgi:carbon monoxide dehydrogenase subunit G
VQLNHRFTVPASIDETWSAFNNLERIAPCFPGAALTSVEGDEFTGTCKIKLGPISMQYAGSGTFLERDEAGHRAVIEAKGKDKRGNGTAAATVTAQLIADGDTATDVEVVTDLAITGKPAQFGRGVMQDVSDKLLGQFATCLETKLGPAAAVAEPEAAGDVGSGEPAPEPSLSSAGSGAASASAPTSESATASASAPTSESAAGQPAAELDLGTTVLPILVKRYAPYAIGLIVVLFLLKRLLGRRRD